MPLHFLDLSCVVKFKWKPRCSGTIRVHQASPGPSRSCATRSMFRGESRARSRPDVFGTAVLLCCEPGVTWGAVYTHKARDGFSKKSETFHPAAKRNCPVWSRCNCDAARGCSNTVKYPGSWHFVTWKHFFADQGRASALATSSTLLVHKYMAVRKPQLGGRAAYMALVSHERDTRTQKDQRRDKKSRASWQVGRTSGWDELQRGCVVRVRVRLMGEAHADWPVMVRVPHVGMPAGRQSQYVKIHIAHLAHVRWDGRCRMPG